MSKLKIYITSALLIASAITGCGGGKNRAAASAKVTQVQAALGDFNADSAYSFVADQVNFGPRVPGTAAHKACGDYLVSKLAAYGADTIIVQSTTVKAYNGDKLPIRNILARYGADKPQRILLVAHWDTRPWANMDEDPAHRNQPVPGANDGASGVGVLLEIARNLGLKNAECGVDILLTDAEDYGSSDSFTGSDASWCLGTQYWVNNMPYTAIDMPRYGILLDMVGGMGARFHVENFSERYASRPTTKVWGEARALGYEEIFVNSPGGAIIDDHVFITRAGIPTTNIIESNNDITGSFPSTWHTLEDDMTGISRRSLEVVGKTVLNVIYKEKAQ